MTTGCTQSEATAAAKMSPPPYLPVDIIARILTLLPPDDAGSTVRASCVCKQWRSILTDPAFCRCYRRFQRAPPLLGYIKQEYDSPTLNRFPRFLPTTSFRTRHAEFGGLILLDARHGRVIFARDGSDGFVIWDLVTDGQVSVPAPPSCHGIIDSDVAVMCGADGCDHLHCHGGHSLVALVGVVRWNEDTSVACLYSTATGAWSDTTSIDAGGEAGVVFMLSRAVVSNALYFVCFHSLTILRYSLVTRELSVIDWPGEHAENIILMAAPAEAGVLLCACVQEHRLKVWSSRTSPNGALAWARGRDVELQPELPELSRFYVPSVVGAMDGGGVIFLRTFGETFTIELSSGKLTKVHDGDSVIPYISFYTLDHANSRMPLP